jgi:hypothetical protein
MDIPRDKEEIKGVDTDLHSLRDSKTQEGMT